MNTSVISRRAVLAAAALAAAPIPVALAQNPARPARVLVGFSPGGSTDVIARLLAERLRGAYRPSVIVENRSGAGGRMAVQAVKAAPADGSTILLTPGSILTIYPHLYRQSLRYDALRDFVPVTTACASPFALMVAADHPALDVSGFLAWAKSLDRPVAYASPAAGSTPHFLGVQLGKVGGITMSHVPYRGSAPALQDLLAGHLPAVVCVLGEGTELHRSGRTRILAISSAERVSGLSEVPTFAELGYPSLIAEEWFGLLVPARTPPEIVAALHAAITEAVAAPELRQALGRLEYRSMTEAPAAFAERIAADGRRWAPIIAESGFNPHE